MTKFHKNNYILKVLAITLSILAVFSLSTLRVYAGESPSEGGQGAKSSSNRPDQEGLPAYAAEGDCNTFEDCGIVRYLVIIINALSALAGVAIIGSIVYGGIQYSMAGSDPQKVGAAKDRIRNAIIALVFFIFGYGILNYLVPGGVLP